MATETRQLRRYLYISALVTRTTGYQEVKYVRILCSYGEPLDAEGLRQDSYGRLE